MSQELQLQAIAKLLAEVAKQQRLTNWFLAHALKQEKIMTDKVTQALQDFDDEIAAFGQDINDLSKRLAATPPGADADAIAAQIETRVATLKATADPLKALAVTPTPAASLVSDTPTDASVVQPTTAAPAPTDTPSSTTSTPAA